MRKYISVLSMIVVSILLTSHISLMDNRQQIDCSILNTTGYNTKSEYKYLQKIEKSDQFGCGSSFGKEIFFKNNHPQKTIEGFIVKSWKYNNGYTIYDVCEKYDIKLKPAQLTNLLGCNYISQNQPCEFKIFGRFTE